MVEKGAVVPSCVVFSPQESQKKKGIRDCLKHKNMYVLTLQKWLISKFNVLKLEFEQRIHCEH